MALNWIDVSRFDFRCLLLMERFQLQYLCESDDMTFRAAFGRALRGHPDVAWYIAHRVPEASCTIEELVGEAPPCTTDELRDSEIAVMRWCEDFVIYTQPSLMQMHCDFIFGWAPSRLHELADLTGMRVLDVGSGSGRLTFAAAEKAREVYAVEPVETLRAYLRNEAVKRHLTNLRITDGMCESLPYPDNTFDAVISGHVMGDDYDAEIAELERVCKPGGLILDVPGDQRWQGEINEDMIRRGFEALPYQGSFGTQVVRYRKVVQK